MRHLLLIATLLPLTAAADKGATFSQTPYREPKVVFDFYFDEPAKINPALFWLRALVNPLTESPYDMSPELMDIKVIVHGTEIVTLAKHNYARYRDAVERMRYYSELGVEFRVCGLAAQDFNYAAADFHDFVIIAPSAITELAHWQSEGYSLIAPTVMEKKFSVEEIR